MDCFVESLIIFLFKSEISFFLSNGLVLSKFAQNTERAETNFNNNYFSNYFGYIKCSAIYKSSRFIEYVWTAASEYSL